MDESEESGTRKTRASDAAEHKKALISQEMGRKSV
jgi:hypothetical protein